LSYSYLAVLYPLDLEERLGDSREELMPHKKEYVIGNRTESCYLNRERPVFVELG
jgi:hypothetical protein